MVSNEKDNFEETPTNRKLTHTFGPKVKKADFPTPQRRVDRVHVI